MLPDLAAVHFIARAITPPKRPLRFDSRFFAADVGAIVHRAEGFVGPEAELVELVWLPITEARRLDMPGITAVVLEELQDRIASGMSHDHPAAVLPHAAQALRARGAVTAFLDIAPSIASFTKPYPPS